MNVSLGGRARTPEPPAAQHLHNCVPHSPANPGGAECDRFRAACSVQWKSKGKRKKGDKEKKKQDLYALLGLKDLRWMATDSQLKKAYQKTALKHHPDKACANVEDPKEKERLEEHFKLILVRCLSCPADSVFRAIFQ